MHRFYIPPHAWRVDRLRLDAAEAHHALDVLRLGAGDRLTVFNGRGEEATAEIVGCFLKIIWRGRTRQERDFPERARSAWARGKQAGSAAILQAGGMRYGALRLRRRFRGWAR